MKKLFLDTEFTGLHQKTNLISIGIISECGKTFYAEFDDYDKLQLDVWLIENVINKLKFKKEKGEPNHYRSIHDENEKSYSVEFLGNTEQIKCALEQWLMQFGEVEIWSDCLSYDWVLFCQIFGHSFNIPESIYYIPFDICTMFKVHGIDPDINREDFADMNEESEKHNALWDAKVIKSCYYKAESK